MSAIASAAEAIAAEPDGIRRRLPFVAVLAASFFSYAGQAIAMVALPIIALQETGDPLAAGAVGVCSTVPLIAGGALGGVVVDRVGYRVASVVADVVSALAILAIPIVNATVGLPFWGMLTLVFLAGLLDPPGDTAKTALVPDLARLARIALPRAAGAQSAVQRTASMIGGAAAGALVAFAGAMPALYVDAAGFVVAAVLVGALVPRATAGTSDGATDAQPDAARGRLRDGFVDGFRFLVHAPLLRAIVLLVTLTNAIDIAGMTVLKPLYATRTLGDPALLGFMVGCFAAGALSGSVLFGAVGHRLSGRTMFAVCFVLAGTPPYLAMALGAPPQVLLPVVAVSGLFAGAINPMAMTAMYGVVPEHMRARVFGLTTAGVAITMPLGALLGGLGAQRLGLTATAAICAILYLLLGSSPLYRRAFASLSAARD